MFLFLASIGLLLAAVLAARAFGFARVKPWAKHLENLQRVLTIAGIMVAAVWYFFERPQAKLNLEQEVVGIGLDGGRVLILAQVSASNAGSMALDFTGAPYFVYVHQVTPLTQTPYSEFETEVAPKTPRKIHPAVNWSPLARLSSIEEPGVSTLTSFVEAGETENLYFRTILPCKPELRVYVSSRFEKPQMWLERMMKKPKLYWVKQDYLDLSAQCPSSDGISVSLEKKRTG